MVRVATGGVPVSSGGPGSYAQDVRIWWLVLVLTVSSVVTLLLAPPQSGHDGPCAHSTVEIVLSPGYTDGEMAGSDPDADHTTCAPAAWGLAGIAAGVGLVGGAATWAIRRIGIRRRTRSAGSAEAIEAGVPIGS